MHAILHLTVIDQVTIDPATPEKAADVRKVEVSDKMELNIDVSYEEFKRLLQNTAAASLGSLFEHTFSKYEAACKDTVMMVQAEKMKAAEKAAAEAKAKAEAEAQAAKQLPAAATPAPAVAPNT